MDYIEDYGDNNFSNFEGDEEIMIYTGENDDMLNFGGAQSFADENKTGRIFVMNIVSTIEGATKVVLMPSFLSKLKGRKVAANGIIVQSPDKLSDIKGVGSPSTIQTLHEFVKHAPCNLLGMRVTSNAPAQLQEIVTIEEHSPFRNVESKSLFLGSYISENQFKDNMVTVPTPNVILGAETEIALNILKGQTTITFHVGAIMSPSSALRKKTTIATRNIAHVGLDNVKRLH